MDIASQEMLHVLEYTAEILRRKDRQRERISEYEITRTSGFGSGAGFTVRLVNGKCVISARVVSLHPPFSSSQLPAFVSFDL